MRPPYYPLLSSPSPSFFSCLEGLVDRSPLSGRRIADLGRKGTDPPCLQSRGLTSNSSSPSQPAFHLLLNHISNPLSTPSLPPSHRSPISSPSVFPLVHFALSSPRPPSRRAEVRRPRSASRPRGLAEEEACRAFRLKGRPLVGTAGLFCRWGVEGERGGVDTLDGRTLYFA